MSTNRIYVEYGNISPCVTAWTSKLHCAACTHDCNLQKVHYYFMKIVMVIKLASMLFEEFWHLGWCLGTSFPCSLLLVT